MRLAIWILCLWGYTTSLSAGAWPRGEGNWFVSAGGNVFLAEDTMSPLHHDPSLFLEYGATSTISLGAEFHTADRGRIDSAFVFASYPLGTVDGPNLFAATLALGMRDDPFNPLEHLTRVGLSWGRGNERGWMSVDASTTYGDIDRVFRPKVDATWGHNVTDRWTSLVQLQAGQGFGDDYYAKLHTAAVFRATPRYRVSLGMMKALTGDRGTGVRLELWADF